MNLIEEAAKRLRQLEEAGVQLNVRAAPVELSAQPKRPVPQAKKRPAPQPHPAQVRNLDLGRMQANGFITPTMPESRLLHEFRVLKRPLIQHALGRTATQGPNRNLIMVTSALSGEGKTYVALNLAMSLAMEVDCRVLLVDADVIRPSVPRVLGIEPARGLMDILTRPDTDLGDVTLGTNVERLTLLLAGTAHAGASEVLASDAMTTLLADMSSRYPDQIVVFDSPPLLATTESRVLATYMGQVVVVVEAENTTHGMLESALSTVESCPLVYTLLNKASESKGSLYGYGAHSHGR
jgi:receptor protein-tyrosine kinase